MQVAIADMPEADLLSEFEAASSFISEGLSSRGILVPYLQNIETQISILNIFE